MYAMNSVYSCLSKQEILRQIIKFYHKIPLKADENNLVFLSRSLFHKILLLFTPYSFLNIYRHVYTLYKSLRVQ